MINPFDWDTYLAQPPTSVDGIFEEFRSAAVLDMRALLPESNTANVFGRADILRLVLQVAASITGASAKQLVMLSEQALRRLAHACIGSLKLP